MKTFEQFLQTLKFKQSLKCWWITNAPLVMDLPWNPVKFWVDLINRKRQKSFGEAASLLVGKFLVPTSKIQLDPTSDLFLVEIFYKQSLTVVPDSVVGWLKAQKHLNLFNLVFCLNLFVN